MMKIAAALALAAGLLSACAAPPNQGAAPSVDRSGALLTAAVVLSTVAQPYQPQPAYRAPTTCNTFQPTASRYAYTTCY
jgi:hypothetical protein